MTNVLAGLVILGLAACGWLAVVNWRLRQQLHDSQRAFRTLVANAPVGVVQADVAGRYIYANEAWSRISGLSPEETGEGWASIVHPDDRPETTARWGEAVRKQQPYTNELRLVRPDGLERTIVAAVHPMKGSDGETSGFIGMVLDVTELREVRRQVLDQTALLKDLIDHSSAAIYVKDAQGRYLLANNRPQRALARDARLPAGHHAFRLVSRRGREVVRGIRQGGLGERRDADLRRVDSA
jgi:PAS domain S-box